MTRLDRAWTPIRAKNFAENTSKASVPNRSDKITIHSTRIVTHQWRVTRRHFYGSDTQTPYIGSRIVASSWFNDFWCHPDIQNMTKKNNSEIQSYIFRRNIFCSKSLGCKLNLFWCTLLIRESTLGDYLSKFHNEARKWKWSWSKSSESFAPTLTNDCTAHTWWQMR